MGGGGVGGGRGLLSNLFGGSGGGMYRPLPMLSQTGSSPVQQTQQTQTTQSTQPMQSAQIFPNWYATPPAQQPPVVQPPPAQPQTIQEQNEPAARAFAQKWWPNYWAAGGWDALPQFLRDNALQETMVSRQVPAPMQLNNIASTQIIPTMDYASMWQGTSGANNAAMANPRTAGLADAYRKYLAEQAAARAAGRVPPIPPTAPIQTQAAVLPSPLSGTSQPIPHPIYGNMTPEEWNAARQNMP